MRWIPGFSIEGQSAGGDGAVQMNVGVELLVPGVEDGGDSEFSAEFPGGKTQEGFGDGLEEDVEDDFLIRQRDGIEFVRQGEDGMEVGDWQEFSFSGGEPAGFGEGLALGAMTVAAGIIGGACKAALIAAVHVAAEGDGPAGDKGAHDF